MNEPIVIVGHPDFGVIADITFKRLEDAYRYFEDMKEKVGEGTDITLAYKPDDILHTFVKG